MEPVSLIVAALVAGATAAVQGVAGDAIKDAYTGLKSLLKRAFAGKPEAVKALDEPQVEKTALENEVRESGAATDEEVLKQAQKLLQLVDPEGSAAGKYTVKVTGGIVGAIGDHAKVNIGVPPTP